MATRGAVSHSKRESAKWSQLNEALMGACIQSWGGAWAWTGYERRGRDTLIGTGGGGMGWAMEYDVERSGKGNRVSGGWMGAQRENKGECW